MEGGSGEEIGSDIKVDMGVGEGSYLGGHFIKLYLARKGENRSTFVTIGSCPLPGNWVA